MDAVAYITAYARMCDSFDSKNNITGKPCVGCPLDDIGRGCHMNDLTNNAEECVAAVEKWAKEHPVKTRQSEFLKQWPDAEVSFTDGYLTVKPCKLCKNMRKKCVGKKCDDCRKEFWSAEVESNHRLEE